MWNKFTCEYKEIVSKKKLSNCPICGKPGRIWDFVRSDGHIDGIGKVGCDCKDSKCFGYSGKMGITKLEAIGAWLFYCKIPENFRRC